ncbi:LysR family transcriptional regulator [Neobacillus mesonae]|nr:LysR family transcriptional regulator [Neobacillus mesonae]
MNLIKFQILVLIDKWNKVTDVAKELDMKQPTVSFHMKSLEKDMGTALYFSTRGRIMLTEAGKAILPYAKQMLQLGTKARETALLFSELNQGSIQIKSDLITAEYVLPKLMSEFALHYPGIRITHRLYDESLDQGNEEGFLLAKLDKPDKITETGTSDRLLLHSDKLILLVPENHPFTHDLPLQAGELSKWMFVEYEDSGWITNRVERFTEITGVHLWRRMSLATPEAAKRVVAQGKAITFFPASGVKASDKGVAAVPIPGFNNEDSTINTFLYKNNDLTPAADQFWSFVQSENRNPQLS